MEAATENRKVIGYARVSTEQQVTDGCSLEVQAQRIGAYCTAQGLELVAMVREEAVSGGIPLAERDGGAELLRLVAERRARHVVAFKLDRLFRDAMDALRQTRDWDQAGVALHVIDMGGQAISTGSAVGRMFFTMTAAFAELERNLISERTSSALRHKASRGARRCLALRAACGSWLGASRPILRATGLRSSHGHAHCARVVRRIGQSRTG